MCNLLRSTPGFDSSSTIQHDCYNSQSVNDNLSCLGISQNHCHTKVLGGKVDFRNMGISANDSYCITLERIKDCSDRSRRHQRQILEQRRPNQHDKHA